MYYENLRIKRLEAKWIRKDGWKAKRYLCISNGKVITLTLYSSPEKTSLADKVKFALRPWG